MKLNFKKLLPVCLLCLLFPISRVSAGKPEAFTPEQCQAIIQYVAAHGGPAGFYDWAALKRELHLPQTAPQILHKYTFVLNPRINRGPWTDAEDQAILNGVKTYGKQWTLIAEKMGTGRTEVQVRQRFVFSLNPTLKKGQFTDEEDQKIRDWVAEHGPKDWGKCANGPFGNTRSAKQLRARWENHLKPNLNKAPWSPEEDQIIIQQFNKVGPKWTYIATLLPGRSNMAIKNRWHNSLKKRSLGGDLPTVQAGPTAQLPGTPAATSGNGDFMTDFSFTPVDNNTNNNDFTLFSFESPLEQALNDNLGLPGSFDYFDFSEFK
jgi:Myb superfamily proteins, including transcription factors and mRNA splicing factors